MKEHSRLFAKYPHASLLRFLSSLTLSLILALFATPVHSTDVTLAWDPNSEPDLAGYKLYYKTESSGPPYDGTGAIEGDSPIDVGDVTEFTIRGLTDGVTYFFVVTAHDTEGLESDCSNEVNTDPSLDTSLSISTNSAESVSGCFIATAGLGLNMEKTLSKILRTSGWPQMTWGEDLLPSGVIYGRDACPPRP
jgi:hypothetical protein